MTRNRPAHATEWPDGIWPERRAGFCGSAAFRGLIPPGHPVLSHFSPSQSMNKSFENCVVKCSSAWLIQTLAKQFSRSFSEPRKNSFGGPCISTFLPYLIPPFRSWPPADQSMWYFLPSSYFSDRFTSSTWCWPSWRWATRRRQRQTSR